MFGGDGKVLSVLSLEDLNPGWNVNGQKRGRGSRGLEGC